MHEDSEKVTGEFILSFKYIHNKSSSDTDAHLSCSEEMWNISVFNKNRLCCWQTCSSWQIQAHILYSEEKHFHI